MAGLSRPYNAALSRSNSVYTLILHVIYYPVSRLELYVASLIISLPSRSSDQFLLVQQQSLRAGSDIMRELGSPHGRSTSVRYQHCVAHGA